jgi:hypothetical protein
MGYRVLNHNDAINLPLVKGFAGVVSGYTVVDIRGY